MLKIRGMNPTTLFRAYLAGRRIVPSGTHVFLCVADHFEPEWNDADESTRIARIDHWANHYPASVDSLTDSRGRSPQHTFFYPIETYRPEHVERLMPLVRGGFGDIEVHLHHDRDTDDALRERLLTSVDRMHRDHGLFTADSTGRLRYGFIHGNWALDNSHPDGRWCGVNNELTVLVETGCYADFTMPAAPHPAQTRTINQIYYAQDDPERPKSHDTGTRARVDQRRPDGSLMMIQGPLVLSRSPDSLKPSVENGNLIATQPPRPDRIDDWMRAGVCVEGHPQWLFIKLHTHGAQEKNSEVLLGPAMRRFHEALRDRAEERGFEYFYVTAREMAQLVHQAEQRLGSPDFDSLHWSAGAK